MLLDAMTELDLNTLANLAEVFGAITIVGGAVFAIVQMRQMRTQRRDAAAIAFLDSVQDGEFARAYLRVLQLPDEISVDELRQREAKFEEAAIFLATNFETVGLMVYRDLVDFEIVRDLIGDAVVAIWRKLRLWTLEQRKLQARETVFDWFEWLALQLEEDAAREGHLAVFVLRRKWRPRRSLF